MKTVALIVAWFCFFSVVARAAKVAKTKGHKVLIELEGDAAQRGDLFYTLDSNGKKRGLIKILKVKGDKALGIFKGRAEPGWALQYRPRKQAATPAAEAATGAVEKKRSYIGFMAGYAMQNMNVDVLTSTSTTQTASMSGSGFSAKVLFDYSLFDHFWFRGMFGYESLSVSSNDTFCGDATNEKCKTDIGYITADMWARYMFGSGEKHFQPWIGAGLDLLFPMTKDSTAVDKNSITNTSVFAAAAGFDYFLSSKWYIPFQVEYGLFPSSNDVTANYISARVGVAYGW